MTNVGSADLDVEPSAKGFGRKLSGQLTREMPEAGKKAGAGFSSGFDGSLKKLAGLAAGAVAGEKVIGFLHDSVSAASDLNETTNMSSVIFGKNADAVRKWSTTTDTALGLSQQAALDSRASFGDMFLQLGLGETNALNMSKSVVQLASDLGSFKNLTTEDVLDRLAGGFRGEYDALQRVIPNISAARVQQEALRQTHKKSVSDLTAADKATATLAIVQKDGARAAGDFARTSGGLANSQKIQAAEMENLRAKIGTGLLPIQLKLTRFLADEAIPAVGDFVDGMHDGTGAGGQFADALHDLYSIGKGVVGVLDGLPGPVKKFGAEGLIAYAVLNKVSGIAGGAGMTGFVSRAKQFRAEMSSSETRLGAVSRASYKLGEGLRGVAGAAGLVAVTDGLHRSNQAVSVLETTLGGAAVGFSAGGPIGAAVGGLAGFTTSLYTSTKRAAGAAKAARKEAWAQYAATLDQVTGATTELTSAQVRQRLANAKVFGVLTETGLSERQVVKAIAQGGPARDQLVKRLNAEYTSTSNAAQAIADKNGFSSKEYAQYVKTHKARQDALGAALQEIGVLRDSQKQTQNNIAVTKDYGHTLDGLPRDKKVAVEAIGIVPTVKGIISVAERINATPKQLKTLIKAAGVDVAVADVQRVIDKMHAADKTRANPRVTVHFSSTGLSVIDDAIHFFGAVPGLGGFAPEGAGADGAIIRRPTILLAGESGPEVLQPLNRTPGNSPLPPAGTNASSRSVARTPVTIVIPGHEFNGYMESVADDRIGAQRGMDGMTGRAL